MQQSRVSTWYIWPLAVIVLAFSLPAILRPTYFLKDDTYFYFQVAYNIVAGHGSTFNQVTPTNGYHPLWQLTVAALYFFFGSDKLFFLHVVTVVSALLAAGTCILYYRFLRNVGIYYWFIPVAAVAIFLFNGMQGSEAQLNGFLLVTGLVLFERALSIDRFSAWVLTAACFSLALLARLDNLFVVCALFSLGLLSILKGDPRRAQGWLLAVSVPAVAILLPYLIWNYTTYGSFMPISGAIKSLFPDPSFDWQRLSVLARTVGGLAAFGLVLATVGRSLTPRLRLILLGLSLGVLLHVGYVGVFTIGSLWNWYYVSGVINGALVIGVVVQLAAPLLSRLTSERLFRTAAISFTCLLLALGTARGWHKWYNPDATGPNPLILQAKRDTPDRRLENMVDFIRSNLPADSRILVWDVPGFLAYFSDRHIVPVDGLMNDFRYNDDIVTQGIVDYMREHDITYYFGPFDLAYVGLLGGPQRPEEGRLIEEILANAEISDGHVTTVTVFSALYRTPAGALPLGTSKLLFSSGEGEKKWGLWRLDLEATGPGGAN